MSWHVLFKCKFLKRNKRFLILKCYWDVYFVCENLYGNKQSQYNLDFFFFFLFNILFFNVVFKPVTSIFLTQ